MFKCMTTTVGCVGGSFLQFGAKTIDKIPVDIYKLTGLFYLKSRMSRLKDHRNDGTQSSNDSITKKLRKHSGIINTKKQN